MTANRPQPTTVVDSPRWLLDPASSSLRFVGHGMWGLLPARGTLRPLQGGLTVDDGGVLTGNLTVDARSLSTGLRPRDWHLHSRQLLDTRRHPTIDVALSAGTITGHELSARCGLTVAGRTVVLPVTAAAGVDGNRLVLRHSSEIDLRFLGVVPRIGFTLGLVRPRLLVCLDLVLTRIRPTRGSAPRAAPRG